MEPEGPAGVALALLTWNRNPGPEHRTCPLVGPGGTLRKVTGSVQVLPLPSVTTTIAALSSDPSSARTVNAAVGSPGANPGSTASATFVAPEASATDATPLSQSPSSVPVPWITTAPPSVTGAPAQTGGMVSPEQNRPTIRLSMLNTS